MPKLTVEQTHTLSADEAKQRLQDLSDKLASKYGINATWTSPTEAKVERTGVSGKIICGTNKVSVNLDLAFMLTPMKGQIEEKLKKELARCLA